MKPEFKLHKDWQSHTGHCQITYVTKNVHNQTIVYCLQDNGHIRLMRCSQDAEPSHKSQPITLMKFERPAITGDLTKKVNEWIDLHEKMFGVK